MHSARASSASRLRNRAVTPTPILHIVGIDARRATGRQPTLTSLLTAIVVNVLEVEGVYVAGDIAQDGQTDVDEQVCFIKPPSSLDRKPGKIKAEEKNIQSGVRWKETYPCHIPPRPILPAEGLFCTQVSTKGIVICVVDCGKELPKKKTKEKEKKKLTEDGEDDNEDSRCGTHGC